MRFFLPLLAAFCIACNTTQPIAAPLPMPRPSSNDSLFHPRQREDLAAFIQAQLNDPMFVHAHWGVKIQSLETGEVWFEQNANHIFNPASNNKLITGAMALDCLGADFRFKTEIYHTGSVQNGILNGDLIIKGSGDPAIGGRFYENQSKAIFKQWANRLKQLGIKKINGNIIGDDNLFSDDFYGKGWELEDMNYGFGAGISALNFDENAIIFRAKRNGNTISLTPDLNTSYFSFDNELSPSDVTKVNDYRIFNQEHFVFKGTVAEEYKTTMSVQNPTVFFVHVLKEVLIAEGLANSETKSYDIDEASFWLNQPQWLFTHESPPFSELLGVFEKESQNQYGEVFARTAGGVCNNPQQAPYSFAMGDSLATLFWQKVGIAPNSYEYADGSGMSRYNWVSPHQLVRLLAFMAQHPQAEVYKRSLAIAGVDGTLKSRMRNTAAQGKVYAKTGTITAIRGLSGYVNTADGEPLAFSILVNGFLAPSRETNRITDAIVVKLAEYRNR